MTAIVGSVNDATRNLKRLLKPNGMKKYVAKMSVIVVDDLVTMRITAMRVQLLMET